MKKLLSVIATLLISCQLIKAQPCTPLGDQNTYGTNNTWIGYVYDNMGFTSYTGYVNEGNAGSPNFDESFGGDYVNYATNGCSVYTETFSVRYKLTKSFAAGTYQFTVGADDGYRLSLDGGTTWVINQWFDQSYNITTYTASLNGSYNIILEYYENGGGNRVSFNVQTACVGTENESVYGTGNIWKGYVYDGTGFNQYKGLVNEGNAGSPDFDESFGGPNTNYITSACPVQTETFSVRYRLQKNFVNGNYTFIAGGDDGYRLSFDGGSTWVINQWSDHGYNTATYSAILNGTYNMVLEFYENGGDNRISFAITGALLPVQLKTFDVTAKGKNALLKWSVSKEVDFAYYLIERSTDGNTFSPIGKIQAGQQSATAKSYQYTDISPAQGYNYYRLRMTDIDGRYTYSAVVRFEFKSNNLLSFFPTVITSSDIFFRTSAVLKDAVIEMYGMTGEKLHSFKLAAIISAGQTISLPIRTNNIPKGSYLLVCKTANLPMARQMIIIQ